MSRSVQAAIPRQIERVKGKLSHVTTNASTGCILGIHQVLFKNRKAVVVRHASTMISEDDELTTFRSSSAATDPMEAFIL